MYTLYIKCTSYKVKRASFELRELKSELIHRCPRVLVESLRALFLLLSDSAFSNKHDDYLLGIMSFIGTYFVNLDTTQLFK